MRLYGLSVGTLPAIIKDACRVQADVTMVRIMSIGKVPEDVIEELRDVEDAMSRAIRLLAAVNTRAAEDKPADRERVWVAENGNLAEVSPDSAIPGWTDTPDYEYGDVS